jgi:hypothetical protein
VDPNQALRDLRALVERVLRDGEGADQDDANALAAGFNALDEWITRGGFLPEPWAKGGRP